MPVGTLATVKGISTEQLARTGAQMVLSNTYHLHLQPGEEIVAAGGGLHRFMGWDGPMLTDSGGFQVFSLGDLNKIDDRGVVFRNPRDGRIIDMTPEHATQIQMALGADVAMAFDQCPPYPATENDVIDACRRTHAWLARCVDAHTREDQALFGIIQGGFWPKLRRRSARQITEIGFDGYALGGLSVGEGHAKMCEVLDYAVSPMPRNSPRYLMGVGRPLDLVEGVARGIDMFDCVIATRHSRSGMFYTDAGRIRMTDKRFRTDMYPPDTACNCYTCSRFTRAYLHHLFRVGEILAATLATIHNLTWYANFMARMRQSIVEGRFEEFRKWVHEVYPEKSETPAPKRRGASKRRR